jgi:hypothetical protein
MLTYIDYSCFLQARDGLELKPKQLQQIGGTLLVLLLLSLGAWSAAPCVCACSWACEC